VNYATEIIFVMNRKLTIIREHVSSHSNSNRHRK